MTPKERVALDVEGIVRDLLRTAEQGSVSDRVDTGYSLQKIDTTARKAIERLKGLLRADGAARLTPGAGNVVLEGKVAIATVSTPEPLVRMAKGADVDALRKALGDDFGEFFDTQVTVTPKKDALRRILELPENVRNLVFASIDQDVGAGGVGFSPRRRS